MGEESSLVVMRSEPQNRRFAVVTVWKFAMGKLDLAIPSLYAADNQLNKQAVQPLLDNSASLANLRAKGYTNMFSDQAAQSPTRWLEVPQPRDRSTEGVNEMLYTISAFDQLEELSKWEKQQVGSVYTVYAGEGPTVEQIISKLREPTGVHESGERMLELCNAWYNRAKPPKETYQMLTTSVQQILNSSVSQYDAMSVKRERLNALRHKIAVRVALLKKIDDERGELEGYTAALYHNPGSRPWGKSSATSG